MNLIERQAEEFSQRNLEYDSYQEFNKSIKYELYEYSQVSHKIQFLETVMFKAKEEYNRHLSVCKALDTCPTNFYYESIIFFMNEIRRDLSKELTKDEFNESDVLRYKTGIDEILMKLNNLEIGQQLTYDDFKDEFEEMKSLFYMPKKSWKQMLAGKLVEMVASGVISETVSKSIVESFK